MTIYTHILILHNSSSPLRLGYFSKISYKIVKKRKKKRKRRVSLVREFWDQVFLPCVGELGLWGGVRGSEVLGIVWTDDLWVCVGRVVRKWDKFHLRGSSCVCAIRAMECCVKSVAGCLKCIGKRIWIISNLFYD